MIDYKNIRNDFNSLKELVEGEILRYDLFPPKDVLDELHLNACKEALEKILKEDPFYLYDLADYQIIEFAPTMFNENIQSLLEAENQLYK